MHSLYSKFLLLALVSGLFLSSCKKSSQPSVVPAIEYKSVNSSTVKQFDGSLVFTIHYKDGDGDLGENNADVKNLFLVDNRIGITYKYRIQQLSPDGSTIPIEGNLDVTLSAVALTDTLLTQQNATFSIYVTDRAGHESNHVTSGNIVILK